MVDVICGYCEWQGKMLALDLLDHPCPKCGKYGGPAIVRKSKARKEGGENG